MADVSYPGVYVQEVPAAQHPIEGVPTSVAVFVDHYAAGPVGQPVRVTSFADFATAFGGLSESSEASFAVKLFFDNGGTSAWIIGVQPAAGGWDPAGNPQGAADALVGDAAAGTGLAALAGIDLFNILCVPATLLLPDAQAVQVIDQATRVCVGRRAMFIVDASQRDADRDTVAGIQAWIDSHPGMRSTNAALYFPRPVIVDPLNGNQRRIAASGVLAGLWALTDADRGVWKAPAGAGAHLQAIVGLAVEPTDVDLGVLNPLAVNCLRRLNPGGLVSWGARTLIGTDAANDDVRYIPVRRLTLFIEESVLRGLQWVVFQPNGPALWAQIQADVSAFMFSLFRQGAFQGANPGDAYFVQCDATTNTQAEIDNGIVQLLIGFAALRPAEFTVIGISQATGP